MRAFLLFAALVSETLLASAQESPRFAVDTADKAYSHATLVAWTENVLEISDGAGRHRLPRFVELRQEERKLPPFPTRNFVLLSNGDRLALDPDAGASLNEERLHVWPAESLGAGRTAALDLFAPTAVLVFWSIPDAIDDADVFLTRLETESRRLDAVFLKNGDRLDGKIAGLSGKIGCTIATDRKKIDVPWSKLAGIAWNTERQARMKTKKMHHRAVLENGARVNLFELRFEEKTRRWRGKTQFGSALELSEFAVLALDTRLGDAIDLSELTPAGFEHRPYLNLSWPLGKDLAADGQRLRVAGSTFEKGIGLHAPSKASYALDGKYRRFDAVVGIDSIASPRGRARIAIALDGKCTELNAGKEISSAAAPLNLRLDVQKCRTLTLITETGAFGDVQANVNWAKARLIKRE